MGQILDQIFDQVFGQVFDQIFDQIFDQALDQGFWIRKYTVQLYWDRKRLHANYYSPFRAYQKNRLPAIY